MKYKGTLIAVTDMEKSKEFYKKVLGLHVTADFGANVTLTGGIYLQTVKSWKDFIHRDASFYGNDAELYFEEESFDEFAKKLESLDVEFIHAAVEHPWGQSAVRFYDPDGHIIEVGESLKAVTARFIAAGLTEAETAERMEIPIGVVKKYLK